MTKPEAYAVSPPTGPQREKQDNQTMPEPLSGSKTVKNQQHKGQRHGEGR